MADDRDEPNKTTDIDSLNSSNDSFELTKHDLDYIPNQVKADEFFSSETIERLKEPNNIDHQNFQDFLQALVLCH